MIPLGSNKFLISFITCTPVGPISSGSRACLPHPMPCSPVHVPPMAKARLGWDEREKKIKLLREISFVRLFLRTISVKETTVVIAECFSHVQLRLNCQPDPLDLSLIPLQCVPTIVLVFCQSWARLGAIVRWNTERFILAWELSTLKNLTRYYWVVYAAEFPLVSSSSERRITVIGIQRRWMLESFAILTDLNSGCSFLAFGNQLRYLSNFDMLKF